MKTLADLVFHIRDAAAGRPDLVTVAGGETLSTSDFIGSIHGLVLALDTAGLGPGQRVAVVAGARPEWLLIDLACHVLGAVSVPLAPNRTPESLGFALRNAGARWIFYEGPGENIRSLAASMAVAPRLVALDPAGESSEHQTFTRLIGGMAERRGEVPLTRFADRTESAAPATIVYSEGTRPEGIVFSHDALLAALEGVEERYAVGTEDRVLSMLTPDRMMQRLIDYSSLRRGAALMFGDPEQLVTTPRPTVVVAPPELLSRSIDETTCGFGSELRLAIADAPLEAALHPKIQAHGARLLQSKRAAGTVLTFDHVDDLPEGAVGRVLAGVSLRTTDDGQLRARGPAVPEVLWQRQDGGDRIGRDGWLRTGCAGTVDARGFLVLRPQEENDADESER